MWIVLRTIITLFQQGDDMAIDYAKKSTRYTNSGLAVFDLDICDKIEITQFVEEEVDEVDSFRDLYERITRAIHTLPSLFHPDENINLNHLKIYLGRSNNVGHRLEQHWLGHKDLPYGIPLCLVSSKNAPSFEKFGIHFLKYLQNKNSLCVGSLENVKTNGGRENGSSVIYLSFGIDKRFKMSGSLKKEFIPLALGKIHGDLDEKGETLDPEDIKICLETSSDPSLGLKLYWHRSSRSGKIAS